MRTAQLPHRGNITCHKNVIFPAEEAVDYPALLGEQTVWTISPGVALCSGEEELNRFDYSRAPAFIKKSHPDEQAKWSGFRVMPPAIR
jgi:hypothetical protein